jgi:thiamine pyrophosphokinase
MESKGNFDVDQATNTIDFSFLDNESSDYKPFCYSVMIILNRPIIIDQYLILKSKSDYVVCADGAANEVFDSMIKDKQDINKFQSEIDCIIGDFDSIRPEVHEYFKKQKVKLLMKNEQTTSDLNKCLYFALEKISEKKPEKGLSRYSSQKKCAIFILGSSGGRIDHTLSTFHSVAQYNESYAEEMALTEIYLISKSSMSCLLRKGENLIINSENWENKAEGYSLIPFFTPSSIIVNIEELKLNGDIFFSLSNKELQFGSNLLFRKKMGEVSKIRVKVESSSEKEDDDKIGIVLYTMTTIFHNRK